MVVYIKAKCERQGRYLDAQSMTTCIVLCVYLMGTAFHARSIHSGGGLMLCRYGRKGGGTQASVCHEKLH